MRHELASWQSQLTDVKMELKWFKQQLKLKEKLIHETSQDFKHKLTTLQEEKDLEIELQQQLNKKMTINHAENQFLKITNENYETTISNLKYNIDTLVQENENLKSQLTMSKLRFDRSKAQIPKSDTLKVKNAVSDPH